MLINVVARDRGWLFEDIKRHFVRVAEEVLDGERGPRREWVVSATEKPLWDFDALIYLRTAEATASPDLSRTVVQVHDLFGYDGPREAALRGCGAIVFTHPDQMRFSAIARIGVETSRKGVICRPIGALEAFKPQQRYATRPFTVGWCGRPFVKDGRDLKRSEWMIPISEALRPCEVGLCGSGLDRLAERLNLDHRTSATYTRRKHCGEWGVAGPAFYRSIDVLVATSESPAIPLPVFEALACGVPVVSTPRSWPGLIDLDDGETPEELAAAIRWVRNNPEAAREKAQQQQKRLAPYTMEGWIVENLKLAERLAR